MNTGKKRSWRKRISIMGLALLMVLSLGLGVACDTGTSDGEERTLYKLADPQWDSVQFHNSVAEIILNNGYDIDTEIVSGSTPITWQAINDNEIQSYMEVWSEQLNNYVQDVVNGPLIEVGINFSDNAQGLYVPRYVIEGDAERGIEPMAPDLKSIHDLRENAEFYKEVFKDPDNPSRGRIYGAIPGWEIDGHLRNKFEVYGLNEDYIYFSPGSDPALAASLAAAYERGDAWVGYYWEPTWVSGKYDIVLLEDDPYTNLEDLQAGYNEFPSNNVTIVVNPIVEEEHPEVVEMLSRYHTSSALTAEALAYMEENDKSTDEAAAWFLNKYPELLEEWVADDDRIEKIKAAIAE